MPLPAPALLETPRLRLRPVAPDDLPDLLVVNGDDEVTRHLPYASWRDLDDARAWLGRIAARVDAGDSVQYVIVAGDGLQARDGTAPGRVIGSCVLFRHDDASRRAELGYVLGRAHWGRRLASEAMRAFVAHGLAAGLRRLDAVIDPRNVASARVLEHLGFVREGLLREHVVDRGEASDSALYGLLAADFRPEPPKKPPQEPPQTSSPKAPSATAVVADAGVLDALVGTVGEASLRKEVDHLHPVYRRWIAASPFAVLATVGPEGVDASPRGDPAPLVQMPDAHTLWLPERRGNNRVDSLRNIVRDPRVALLFLIPAVGETLRVNGRARIRTDTALRERCAIDGAVPACVIEVAVERVYFQCARAMQRSGLWQAGAAGAARPDVPTAGAMLAALTDDAIDGSEYDLALPARQRATLY